MAAGSLPFVPAQSVGPFALGASIHEVLTIVKQEREQYPAIDLHYSHTEPVLTPVIVSLPANGLRLRFDGADQRLRLIEILDFRKLRLVYKGSELNKAHKDTDAAPTFKRVYQLLGASYPGEYLPPGGKSASGTYILSWPGVAFSFPLQHSAWSPEKDHVSLLGSSAASPAQHMAIFEGNDWPEARKDLFVRIPGNPRLSAAAKRNKDSLPAEIEFANINCDGYVELVRATPAPSFYIVLNETTPQDLTTELGPPDTMHKRHHTFGEPETAPSAVVNRRSNAGSLPSSYSSTGTDTFDADFDSGEPEDDPSDSVRRERFWCYFSHGMDILVGPPANNIGSSRLEGRSYRTDLVVTKVVIHGNVPGSYAFNRHRRLRWVLDMPADQATAMAENVLSSEANFESEIKPILLQRFAGTGSEEEMGRGKVVNRTWGADPSDSSFFLPDAGEDLVEGGGSEQWLGNTRLYTFPGLNFEVLENGSVSAVTVR